MGKRKDSERDVEDLEEDVVNVDFDFFDLKEDDFLSVKSLLRQLLDVDSTFFNLSALAQLTVDSKVGTAVKADDEEYNDVLAMLAVADLGLDPGSETRKLADYWIERTAETGDAGLNRLLRQLVHKKSNIGVVLSDRFLNMPFDVVAPLYTILAQECAARGVSYDYLIIPSRVYTETISTLSGPVQPSKKGARTSEYFMFHPEDTALAPLAQAHGHFDFKTPIDETDSRRAFQENGIMPHGSLLVLRGADLAQLAPRIEQMVSQAQ